MEKDIINQFSILAIIKYQDEIERDLYNYYFFFEELQDS